MIPGELVALIFLGILLVIGAVVFVLASLTLPSHASRARFFLIFLGVTLAGFWVGGQVPYRISRYDSVWWMVGIMTLAFLVARRIASSSGPADTRDATKK